MQFSIISATILALTTSTLAAPSPQSAELQCWETCSLDCIKANNVRGGLCSSDGTCSCLTGLGFKREAEPEPQYELSPEAQCWTTCGTSCLQGGNLRGGLCDAAGTCTCFSGYKREALPEAIAKPQSAVIDCWSTCSTGCVQAGNYRGGLCDASGSCTCLQGAKREAVPEPEAEASPQNIDCYTNCSVDCISAGNVEGGMCDASGNCQCL